jgi:hypothetical protein
MPSKTFKTEDLRLIVQKDHETAKVIRDRVTDHSRWSVGHECIFELDGHYYRTYYSVGATEYQDEGPYEYDGEKVKCTEVIPAYKAVVDYIDVDGHSDFWHNGYAFGYLAGTIGWTMENPFNSGSDAAGGWAYGYATACSEQAES